MELMHKSVTEGKLRACWRSAAGERGLAVSQEEEKQEQMTWTAPEANFEEGNVMPTS